jgi:predicted deacylase
MMNKSSVRRVVQEIQLASTPGTTRTISFHKYSGSNENKKKIYIQAALHADEIPGMLVCDHLIKSLDALGSDGEILDDICIVPFANPIGLSQNMLGHQIGRFSSRSGVNFNRGFPDLASTVHEAVKNRLSATDARMNVDLIRKELFEVICSELAAAKKEEEILKLQLFKEAAVSDIVLDLHCDTESVLHTYFHRNLWPDAADLAAELGSHCHLLASSAGGNPFDEACSDFWAEMALKDPAAAIPMACFCSTVELRGKADVSDDLAAKDAAAIVRFLRRRGALCATSTAADSDNSNSGIISPLPALLRPASELAYMDILEASCAGVVVWRAQPGDIVSENDVLGDIVPININAPTATTTTTTTTTTTPRVPIVARTSGLMFQRSTHRLVAAGDTLCKVAGDKRLPWRDGDLLTA